MYRKTKDCGIRLYAGQGFPPWTVLIALLLALFLPVSCFTSCRSASERQDSESETSFGYVLPEDREIRFLVSRGSSESDFTSSLLPESLKDSLPARDRAVQSELGVTLSYTYVDGYGDRPSPYLAELKADSLSGASRYDLLAAYTPTVLTVVSEIGAHDLLSLPTFDKDQIGLPASFQSDALLHDRLYFFTGFLSFSLFQNLTLLYLSPKALEGTGFSAESLYRTAAAGNFSNDEFLRLLKNRYRDLNENQTKDPSDAFGLVATYPQAISLLFGYGLRAISVSSGTIALAPEWTSEHTQKILYDFLETRESADFCFGTYGKTAFTENRSAAMITSGSYIFSASSPFLLLPLPKYDDIQPAYRCLLSDSAVLYAIPASKSVEEALFLGAVCTALSAAGKETVFPALCDAAMGENAPDEKKATFALLYASAAYDHGIAASHFVGSLFEEILLGYLRGGMNLPLRSVRETEVEAALTDFQNAFPFG